MLTYITTYYNERENLNHLKELMASCDDARLKMIIVDDFSDESIEDEVRSWGDDRVSLYRVTEDKGFNSHGARNLAMKNTTTEWNLLVDIDYKVVGIDNIIEQVASGELEPNAVHFLPVAHTYKDETEPSRASINDFLVTKHLFWKARGYDAEFIGFHFGDRVFIDRMLRIGSPKQEAWMSVLFDCHLNSLRSPHATTYLDPTIPDVISERYSHDRKKLYVHPDSQYELHTREIIVKEKNDRGEFTDPIPFTWEQLI